MGSPIETKPSDLVIYTSIVFGSISLIGALFILLSFCLHKRLKTITFRMILWMAIFDAIISCGTVFGPLGSLSQESNSLYSTEADDTSASSLTFSCRLQASCIQFGSLASLIWTLCFTMHLFRITNPRATPNDAHAWYYFVLYVVVTITFPAFSVYYLQTAQIDGQSMIGVSGDFWCWIDSNQPDSLRWKWLYAEVLGLCVVLFFVFFMMRIRLRILRRCVYNPCRFVM